MLKLYSMEWQHPWAAPHTMHYPPNPDIFSMEMVAELRDVFNNYNQVINVCLFRGFVAAVNLEAAVEAIKREFPWAEVTHCNLMIPPLLPEYFGITFDWSLERINHYNQTRGLLPGSIISPNLNVLGWSAVTYFESPSTRSWLIR